MSSLYLYHVYWFGILFSYNHPYICHVSVAWHPILCVIIPVSLPCVLTWHPVLMCHPCVCVMCQWLGILSHVPSMCLCHVSMAWHLVLMCHPCVYRVSMTWYPISCVIHVYVSCVNDLAFHLMYYPCIYVMCHWLALHTKCVLQMFSGELKAMTYLFLYGLTC